MAIISKIKTDVGVVAEYSKISNYSENQHSINIVMDCYLNRDCRLELKDAVKRLRFTVPKYPEGLIDTEGMNHLKYSYMHIMQAYGYEGDEDVITDPSVDNEIPPTDDDPE